MGLHTGLNFKVAIINVFKELKKKKKCLKNYRKKYDNNSLNNRQTIKHRQTKIRKFETCFLPQKNLSSSQLS